MLQRSYTPNELRRLLESLGPGEEVPSNELAQIYRPQQGGFIRREDTGETLFVNGQPNGISEQPIGPNDMPQPGIGTMPAPQPQTQRIKVAGYGNGIMSDVGEMDGVAPPIDYARGPVDTPKGRGYYGKDGQVYVKTPDGQLTKVLLGYDRDASYVAAKRDWEKRKAAADIAHTEEQTAASQQMRESGKVPQAPSGYEWTQSGLRPIPGGPADYKQQGAYNADTATLQSSQADLDRLATSANELLKHKGLAGITGFQGAFPNLPGGDAANAQAKLDTLKSQVGFGVLQAMRNASKTGGALGNVSDAEGKRLEANLAALDKAQSLEQFQESLGKIIEFANGAKERLANAYNLKHGGISGSSNAQNSGQSTAAPQPGSVVTHNGKRYTFLGGDPADKSRWLPNQ